MAYTCPTCGITSHNPNDEKHRFCSRCNAFEDDTLHYVLDDDRQPQQVTASQFHAWKAVHFLETVVEVTDFVSPLGQARVSTCFLGRDRERSVLSALLFETVVLGGRHDGVTLRAGTWDRAVEAHRTIVEMLKAPYLAVGSRPAAGAGP